MTRYLITGAAGFVGKFLIDALAAQDETAEIFGVDLCTPKSLAFPFQSLNLQDKEVFFEIIESFQPENLIHLAAVSSVAASWQNPADCIANNTQILLNVLEAVRQKRPQCRILAVGSSEVYDTVNRNEQSPPLTENTPQRAENPYALGRKMQEEIVSFYRTHYELGIVSTRSFSHTGPGQAPRFAVPSFVEQLTAAKKKGLKKAVLQTGNVDLIRDFSDVRDVVQAYLLLLRKGTCGEFYNVCSGRGVSLRNIIETAAKMSELEAVIEIDPSKIRPSDPKFIVGSAAKLKADTGWQPKYTLEETLRDMMF
jgi:GDP-4-dehydro-6-deoxy-D-mannose reductase